MSPSPVPSLTTPDTVAQLEEKHMTVTYEIILTSVRNQKEAANIGAGWFSSRALVCGPNSAGTLMSESKTERKSEVPASPRGFVNIPKRLFLCRACSPKRFEKLTANPGRDKTSPLLGNTGLHLLHS